MWDDSVSDLDVQHLEAAAMLGTQSHIRFLAAAWLVLGVVSFVRALIVVAQRVIEPSGAADWDDYSLFMALMGVTHILVGRALLRHNRRTRLFLAISSFVLLYLYLSLVLTPPEYAGAGRIGPIGLVPPVLVLVISVWLTSPGRGKQTLRSYLAKTDG